MASNKKTSSPAETTSAGQRSVQGGAEPVAEVHETYGIKERYIIALVDLYQFPIRTKLYAHPAPVQQEAAAAVPESGWRPIETLPPGVRAHNETFYGLVEGIMRRCYYGKTSHAPIYGFNVSDQGPEDCDLCEPTHWYDFGNGRTMPEMPHD